jgi:putative NADH-flavin reductase
MKLVVFGATGKTGHLLIQQALDRGDDVTAVVRNPRRMEISHARLQVVEADIFEPEMIAPAIKSNDAVVSSLGKTSKEQPHVCQFGARSIMKAMVDTGVRRLLVVSNSAHTTEEGDLLPRRLVQKQLNKILKVPFDDLRRMEEEVRASSLDWTILQPARMTDGEHTGEYRLELGKHVRNGWKISRADVADAILRVLDDDATIGTHVAQAY